MSRNPEGAKYTHGLPSSYIAYGCRCEACTKANLEHVKRGIKARTQKAKDPNDPRHGTASFYVNHGCRCQPCRKANSVKCAEYAARRKAKA